MRELIEKNPVPYTYFAVGSAAQRGRSLEGYTEDLNQIFPAFFREIPGKRRAIHVDPVFETPEHKEFLNEYLKSVGLQKTGDLSWSSDDGLIEIVCYAEYLEEQQRDSLMIFLLKEIAIKQSNKVVFQQYTGLEVLPMFMTLYNSELFNSEQRNQIKKNALCDFTYGEDCGCMTMMTRYRPRMVGDSFFNLWCLSEAELLDNIGLNSNIDKLVGIQYKQKYKQLIGIHHVNYRRRLKGLDLYCRTPEYSEGVSPSQIMEIFASQMYPIINVLSRIYVISEDLKAKQMDMLNNYHMYEIYNEWYPFMNSFYKD